MSDTDQNSGRAVLVTNSYLQKLIDTGNRLCKETAQFVVYSEEDGQPQASDAEKAIGEWRGLMRELRHD